MPSAKTTACLSSLGMRVLQWRGRYYAVSSPPGKSSAAQLCLWLLRLTPKELHPLSFIVCSGCDLRRAQMNVTRESRSWCLSLIFGTWLRSPWGDARFEGADAQNLSWRDTGSTSKTEFAANPSLFWTLCSSNVFLVQPAPASKASMVLV